MVATEPIHYLSKRSRHEPVKYQWVVVTCLRGRWHWRWRLNLRLTKELTEVTCSACLDQLAEQVTEALQ